MTPDPLINRHTRRILLDAALIAAAAVLLIILIPVRQHKPQPTDPCATLPAYRADEDLPTRLVRERCTEQKQQRDQAALQQLWDNDPAAGVILEPTP